jgi:tol-pal system protein YbgF
MKTIAVLLPVAAVLASLCGCAASMEQRAANEALLPEIDVVQVKENSEEALKLAQEAKLDVELINTKLTEIDNKLVALTEDVSSVSLAKIEEIENRYALLVEAMKDLQQQISTLEVNPRVAKKAATFSQSSASAILKSSGEYDMYQNGLRTFNSRNYKEAMEVFNKVLAEYEGGTYSDNCHYWIGECYYGLREYANAVTSFNKVFSFANTSKSDDAQLKIALSYLKMGQQVTAQAEFQKLLDRYPTSEYVPRVKKYLEEMK